MPSSYTPNYQLSQWSKGDQVKMEDFNADNAKTDGAIKAEADARAAGDAALQTALNAKASTAALDALSQTVAGKADASALNALTQTVAAKGNCKIVTGSYGGRGGYGEQHPNTITLPGQPLVVIVFDSSPAIMVYPSGHGVASGGAYTGRNYIVFWSGNSVSWYLNSSPYSASNQMNESGTIYHYIALLKA